MRRQFTKLITGIEIWNNFAFVWAEEQFRLFLLDEENLEEADNVKVFKEDFNCAINLVHISEIDWDRCKVTFLLSDLSVVQWTIVQTAVRSFSLERVSSIQPVQEPSRKTVWQIVADRLAVVNCPIFTQDLFNGEESTTLSLISLNDLSVR